MGKATAMARAWGAALCVLAALVALSSAEAESGGVPLALGDSVDEFVQMKTSDGKGYVQLHVAKVPSSAKVYKTIKGKRAACQKLCNKDKKCKGFKITTGSGQCSLLSHSAPKKKSSKKKAKKKKAKKGKKPDVNKLHAAALKHTNAALKKVKAASKASSKAAKKGMKKAAKSAKKAQANAKKVTKSAKKAQKKAVKKAKKAAKKTAKVAKKQLT